MSGSGIGHGKSFVAWTLVHAFRSSRAAKMITGILLFLMGLDRQQIFAASLFGNLIDPVDGRLAVPEGPGLGCDPDPDVVARYREDVVV